jgi:L-lactate dehydrogenase (cytochrome)
MSGVRAKNDAKGGSLGRVMAGYIDATLSWADLGWLRSLTELPIVLKGVMGAADARLAVEYGMQGIVVSNHERRNLDT